MNYAVPQYGENNFIMMYMVYVCVYVLLPVWKHWDSMDTNILN